MGNIDRRVVAALVVLLTAGVANADSPTPPTTPAPPATPTMPTAPTAPTMPDPNASMPNPNGMMPSTSTAMPPPTQDDPNKPKEHKAGDFDAGGQARFPNGPDEMGKYASFNWVAFDGKGTYYLAKSVTLNGVIPLAIKHPDNIGGATGMDPSVFGGMSVRLDAKLPKLPKLPGTKYDTEIGLSLTGAYMREGAMLLSDKDFPLFVGDFQPGFAGGLIMKVKLSNAVDFSLLPQWIFQSGSVDSHKAVQIPMSLILKAGSLLAVSADLAVNTGDDYHFSGDDGGRISTGGSITVKVGKIQVHAGAGVASLLTGPAYPTISDSIYVDLNAKYVK